MRERLVPLWVSRVGDLNYVPQSKTEFTNHILHRYTLRYFPDTSSAVEFPNCRFDIPKGSCIYLPPNIPYKMFLPSDHHPRYYDIKFLPADSSLAESLQKISPPFELDSSSRRMLEYVITHWHLQNPKVQSICEDFLCALLQLLFVDEAEQDAYDSQIILTNRYNKATLITLSYIEKNYNIPFSIKDVEKATRYSKGYLCTNFANNTGMSITSYANFLRIRKAIGALLHFQPKISDVSDGLGFNNFTYFNRVFKSFVGVAPGIFLSVSKHLTLQDRMALSSTEPLLSYQRCSLEESIASMRHIGDHFATLYKERWW